MDVVLVHTPRRTLTLLASATAVGSAGLAAGGTSGALLATEMTGTPTSAGVPLGVLVAGSAVGAVVISRVSRQAGRLQGLALGYVLGAVGALAVVISAIAGDFKLLLLGSGALGAANAAVFLSRYAAADMGGEGLRGRALGLVLGAAAVGAVVSPNLLGPAGRVAQVLGLPHLTGLYLVAVLAFAVAAVLLLAHRDARPRPADPAVAPVRPAIPLGLAAPRVRRAIAILGATNLVMVGTMAVAPVHLTAHGHGLDFVGLAVGAHVMGMFAPSPLSGWLADQVGGVTVAGVGVVLLVVTAFTEAVVDPARGVPIVLVLVMLGLGWNAGVVGGSTMLAASVPAAERPRVEAIGEVAMGLAAAVGAPVAGVLISLSGVAVLLGHSTRRGNLAKCDGLTSTR